MFLIKSLEQDKNINIINENSNINKDEKIIIRMNGKILKVMKKKKKKFLAITIKNLKMMIAQRI